MVLRQEVDYLQTRVLGIELNADNMIRRVEDEKKLF